MDNSDKLFFATVITFILSVSSCTGFQEYCRVKKVEAEYKYKIELSKQYIEYDKNIQDKVKEITNE